MRRLRSLTLLAVAGVACTPEFEQAWLVTDLRILAIRAEPPEVLVPAGTTTFPAVHVDALVVDPRATADTVFDWKLLVCTAEEPRCELAERQELVRQDSTRLDQISLDFTLAADFYQAALAADPLRGFGGVAVMVELQVSRGEDVARGIKRIVYGNFVPPEKQPNVNPGIDRITVDEQPTPQPWAAKLGQKVKLRPSSPAADKEKYWAATFTGGKRELDEYLSYSFFVTTGKLSDATTGGKPVPFVTNSKLTDLSSDWTPAALAEGIGGAAVWIVVHDDRGGVGWSELRPGLVE